MGIISRLPGVGLYVHMLSKVTVTVLNFFATYVWSFLGFAIAFHILLPADGPYGNFADAFIKVHSELKSKKVQFTEVALFASEAKINVF